MSYKDFICDWNWNFYGGEFMNRNDGIADSDTLMDERAERRLVISEPPMNVNGPFSY